MKNNKIEKMQIVRGIDTVNVNEVSPFDPPSTADVVTAAGLMKLQEKINEIIDYIQKHEKQNQSRLSSQSKR